MESSCDLEIQTSLSTLYNVYTTYFVPRVHELQPVRRVRSQRSNPCSRGSESCSLNIGKGLRTLARSFHERGISHFVDVDVARARFNKDELMKIYGAPSYWPGNLYVMICFIHERSFQIVLDRLLRSTVCQPLVK